LVATLVPDALRSVRATVTLFAAAPSFLTLVIACTVGLAADPVVVVALPTNRNINAVLENQPNVTIHPGKKKIVWRRAADVQALPPGGIF
jgi:hypothetical protein